MRLTYRQMLQKAVQMLMQAGVPDASLDAWYLMEHVTGMSRARYFMDQGEEMPEEEREAYLQIAERRCERIPLQHLLGEAYFMGLPFYVNENVLIPRQDTEKLVELVLAAQERGEIPQQARLLDMCTGSGCIAVSLAKLGSWEEVTAADISEPALLAAGKNAERNGCRIRYVSSDLFAALEDEVFDVIVSNPPYIPTDEIPELMPEVREHDPLLALDGHADGLYFYRRLAEDSRNHLREGGSIFLEIGCEQGADVRRLLLEAGYTAVRIEKDDTGHDRVVTGEWKCLIN